MGGGRGCCTLPALRVPALGVAPSWGSPTSPSAFPLSGCCPHPLFLLQRIVLSFDFPFYGHLLRQVTIATGGEWGRGPGVEHGH